MADSKISALAALAAADVAAADVLPIVDTSLSTTKKVAVSDLQSAPNSALTASKPVFTDASKVLTSAGTVPVNQGGTGATTYTDGQLLIGNSSGGTLAKGTLTAGTGISVANSGGAITIAATGATTYPIQENILDNSGFGVWSNSDANQGLGSMPFMGGDIAPVPGETMTGATSGAVGKVIKATVTSGAFGTELVTNGGFASATTGWTADDSALSSTGGGQVGNCLTITNSGASPGFAKQAVTVEVGKIYRFRTYFKKGTGTTGNLRLGTTSLGTDYYSNSMSDSGWTAYSVFVKPTTTTLWIGLCSAEAATNTALFDEVTLVEVGASDLVTNGSFTTDTTGWTADDSALSSTGGGQVGNCLTITNSGASPGFAKQAVTVEVGKIYQLRTYFKKGTGTTGNLRLGTTSLGTDYYSNSMSDSGWTAYSVFVKPTTTTLWIGLCSAEAATNTALFDEVTLTEVVGGTLELGACSGRFHDGEVVNGGTSYASMICNTPASGVGVDLVTNGEFETGTTGWTASDCTLASVAGGQVGNCLEVTRTASTEQIIGQDINLVVGKLYRFSVYVKSGTSGDQAASMRISDSAYTYYAGYVSVTTSASWVKYTFDFEPTTVSNHIALAKGSATAGTMLFDEVSLYEITPSCTAADALAMDGWTKSANLDIYRQHNDGGTLTKDGSFYALKVVVPSGGTGEFSFNSASYDKAEWTQKFAGRTVAIGAWVKTSTAAHAFIGVKDDASYGLSTAHTGDGTWQWLEKSVAIGASTAGVTPVLSINQVGAVDGSTVIYVSSPMLVFGSSIGAGNYAPKPNEEILCEAVIALTKLTSTTSAVDATINLEAESGGRIPKGAKAVLVKAWGKDSAAGDGVGFDLQTSSGVENGLTVDVQVNNIRTWGCALVACDANGDFYFDHRGSGAAALTLNAIVTGVKLR